MPPFKRRIFNARSNQSINLGFRCTHIEKATITSRAKRAGMSTSAYLRTMALNGKITVPTASVDAPLVFQLKKIGTNLNQMARKLNATGKTPPDELLTLCTKINTLLNQITAGE